MQLRPHARKDSEFDELEKQSPGSHLPAGELSIVDHAGTSPQPSIRSTALHSSKRLTHWPVGRAQSLSVHAATLQSKCGYSALRRRLPMRLHPDPRNLELHRGPEGTGEGSRTIMSRHPAMQV